MRRPAADHPEPVERWIRAALHDATQTTAGQRLARPAELAAWLGTALAGRIVVAPDGDRPFDLGAELLGFEPDKADLFEAAGPVPGAPAQPGTPPDRAVRAA